jgi:transcriptional regulator with XRE-family HTH domain
MDFKKLFTERLKKARIDKGFTQEQLGEKTGINQKVISRYEQGLSLPVIDNLQKIVAALEISADYLLQEHSEMKEVPRVKDPELYESYFILESLNEEERKSALFLLNSIISHKKLRELIESNKIKHSDN